MTAGKTPEVTVVIPARNAGRWLPEQLHALTGQRGAPPFEVVVGDNGSTDDTRLVVERFPAPFDVRVVDASGVPSASHARNVAAASARGEVLLFCDADDLVGPDWVRALAHAVGTGPDVLAAGALHHERFNTPEVLAAYRIGPDPKPPADPCAVDEHPAGFAGHLPTAAGGNFGIRRDAYLRLGGMDSRYPGGAEETDFAWRAQESGMRVVAVPAAVVHYRLKSEPRQLFRQQRIQQRGRIYLWTRHRDSGMAGPSLKASALEVLRGLAAWPVLHHRGADMLAWSARTGAHVGALEGMARYRLPRGRSAPGSTTEGSSMTPVLSLARRGKHQALVGRKWAARRAEDLRDAWRARTQGYRFDAGRYPSHRFLGVDVDAAAQAHVPERVFVLWTGDGPMPPIRQRSLHSLEEALGVPLVLVTPRNLDEWLVPGQPLHPAYEHLSLTHRSDYLRAYLLHHYGGGYADVKPQGASWRRVFQRLEGDPAAWMVGYPEDSRGRLPRLGGHLEQDLRRHFDLLLGNGAMVMRAHSPLTAEWLAEVDRRMDYFAPLLAERPGGVRDEAPGYPVGWTQLLADILYPLMLKHHPHLRADGRLSPDVDDYR